MDKYLAACWFVYGMANAKPYLSKKWIKNSKLAALGIAGMWTSPAQGWDLLKFAERHGFFVAVIEGQEVPCAPMIEGVTTGPVASRSPAQRI